jgi:Ser/Thr protein kinase RdoA (MazF antagonist)
MATALPAQRNHERVSAGGIMGMSEVVSDLLTPKFHGMDDRPAEPDWPILTLEEADRLLRRFPDAGGADALLFVSPRPFAAASIVGTPRGKRFVKRHHRSVRDAAGLVEEHDFVAHLRSHGAPVPRVLASAGGASAVEEGEWTYEVHELAAGVDVYQQALSWTPFLTAGHARSAGAALAQLHRAARGYTAPRRKPQPLVSSFTIFAAGDPWPALRRYIAQRPPLAAFLSGRAWERDVAGVLLPFHAALRPLHAGLEPLWGHNDWHASNLTWSDAGPDAAAAAVIDFGLADRTSAVYDLATAIERNAIEWLGVPSGITNYVHLDHVDALLDGYESVSPLTDEQAAALPELLPLVHAEYALSEVEYFYGVLGARDRAELAYDGYFVGHAAWFRGDGRALIEHLRGRRKRP